jgi:hypothetical protein
LDCSCVICILKVGPAVGPNPVTGKGISNLALRKSFEVLCDDLVLLSATTLGNRCGREYALTVDTIMKELPVQNQLSLALDRCISTNKLSITSVIVYYMDRN